MKSFEDCANWGSRLCHNFVKHLYEPIEGSSPIYHKAEDEAAKAISICAKCTNYEKKKTN